MHRRFQRAGGRAVFALSFMLGSLTWAVPVLADEPLFGYTYTADLLPKGKWELEQWITDREGQAFGHYHDFEFRTEVEYGLTDNFQLSGYLNYSYLNAKNNSVAHLTEGLDIPFDHDPTQSYSAMRFDGIAVEGIYRFLSPYKDPIGLAVYVEPEIGPREMAFEVRLILQKNFFDGRAGSAPSTRSRPGGCASTPLSRSARSGRSASSGARTSSRAGGPGVARDRASCSWRSRAGSC